MNFSFLLKVIDWVKDPARYFLPIAVASTLILFLPKSVLEPLGLISFRIESQPYLGIAFLLCWSVVTCDLLIHLINRIRSAYQKYLATRKLRSRLESLTKEEKQIIGVYFEKQTRTCELDVTNGVVTGLVDAKIIYPAVKNADSYRFPCNIQPWAWDYVNLHPELVQHVRSPKT